LGRQGHFQPVRRGVIYHFVPTGRGTTIGEYNFMTSHINEPPSIAEICASVKRLGYAVSEHIRLYGEEFEVVSDPFPDADGIALNVRTKKDANVRVVRLPATVLQSVRGREREAA